MIIYDPTFSSSDVAKAAGMSASNFRAHLSRRNWRIIGAAQPAEANGKGHLFTIYDVLGYALAHQLVAHGVDPKIAFERAMSDFAHTGDDERDPGGVLPVKEYGATLFVYSPGASSAACLGTAKTFDAMQILCPPGHNRASSAIVIHLNDLRDRVFHALGLDARDYE